jgi:hypothetical protein
VGVSADVPPVAAVNSANNTGVQMQFFTAKPDQKWHTHAA